MITLGRDVCRDVGQGIAHEWLVTNGLGGYAAGTIPGVNTRRYHGLLIASLRPPVERVQLLANCDEEVEMDGATYYLGANEYQEERIHPGGFVHLESFTYERAIPTFCYRVGAARLEKAVWMEHGRNTTYVRYHYSEGAGPLTLVLRPFVNYRSHHALTRGSDGQTFAVTPQPIGGGCTIRAGDAAQPFYLLTSPRAGFTPSGVWYWNFLYRVERERGLDHIEDLYLPGVFRLTLQPGESLTLIATTEPATQVDRNADAAFARARARQDRLLRRAGLLPSADNLDAADAGAPDAHQAFVAQLVQAADQFLVLRAEAGAAGAAGAGGRGAGTASRPAPGSDPEEVEDSGSRSVIAGYPWFTDWGRDTMVALPGLTLATGRPLAAAGLLRTFARYVDQGQVLNLFPDAGTPPEYNTVDATLWYFHALEAYVTATNDPALAAELWPLLEDMVRWHLKGTRFGIHVDPADGLLAAGEPGVQLTWMDAKVGDWVVTPRQGKPVEIQALWYHALRIMARLAERLGKPLAAPPKRRHRRKADPAAPPPLDLTGPFDYPALADRVRAEFQARFWYAEGGYLYDVVDGPDGVPDATLRPNQLFALSLEPDLVDAAQAASVLAVVQRELLTPVGLRTLNPGAPGYEGVYIGNVEHRDGAYHRGTIWPWLLGAYGDALRRWTGADRAALTRLLAPLQQRLAVACAGTLSEICDADPPHAARGAFAQAWSVAEVLRLLRS
jgi:glycogen debranching enzyme